MLIGLSPAVPWGSRVLSGAARLLGGEAQGLAIDFRDLSMVVRDTGTPANNFSGNPNSRLTYASPSNKLVRGSGGALRYPAHNLCLRSDTFGSWTPTSLTVTENVANKPSGAATADRLALVDANAQHVVSPTTIAVIAGATYTHSIEAKAETHQFIQLGFGGTSFGTTHFANFDLTNGTSHPAASITASITALGNGWYRCSISGTCVTAGTTTQNVFLVSGTGAARSETWDPNSTNSVLVASSHFYRTPADTTFLTTTTAASFALPIEFDTSRNPLGIRVEPAATNLCLRFAEFDNASWSKVNSSIVSNATTAPDGTTNADKLIRSSGANSYRIQQATTVVSASVYTFSVYAKASEITWLYLGQTGGTSITAYFNLSDGTIGATGAGATPAIENVGNGWYRCSITGTMTGTSNVVQCWLAEGNNDFTFPAGNDTDGLFLWGAQLELGSVATSPIETFGSTVTRAADPKSVLTSAFPFGATAGTRVIRAMTASGSGTQVLGQIGDGTENERYRIVRDASNNIRFIVTDGGVEQANLNLGTVANNTAFKVAVAWAANDIAGCLNGGTVQTDATATLPTVTTARFGSSITGEQWGGTIAEDVMLPRRASNVELQTLSTP